MHIDSKRIQELIDRPGESLSVEIKRWLDLSCPEHQAKIVRALLALRNHDGGYLVIGLDNETLLPDTNNIPDDVASTFHIDKVQGLVSKYASEPFEVTVQFPTRDGQSYPVIVVPSGVRTPVVAKSDLCSKPGGDKFICTGDVYVRSLRANNTPSTTKAKWNDWPQIVETCFDNREADIGRFVRRHLSGISPETLHKLLSVMGEGIQPDLKKRNPLQTFFAESETRYNEALKERQVSLPDHGTWEAALVISGESPAHSTNQEFLNLLASSNPNYTGWPVWLDGRTLGYDHTRPYVVKGVWETFLVFLQSPLPRNVDFMRLDPAGRFYLRRPLEDDISGREPVVKPLSVLDFGLPVIRTAEAMAVGISFARAMGYEPADTTLDFGFRWRKLRGRELSSWANPRRHIFPGGRAYEDEVMALVNVPLETPLSALSEFVNQAVKPLFEVFHGFALGKDVIEDLTLWLLKRRE